MKPLPIMIVALLFLAGFSHAKATCAFDSFMKACDSCTFDANGKMDQQCWKQYEGEGTTCLGLSYPMMSVKYSMGFCPQMDECVQRLSACKERYKSGSDAADCNNLDMIQCFDIGDNCAQAANAVCADGKTEDEAGFNNESAGGPIKDPEPEPILAPTGEAPIPPGPERDIADLFCGPGYLLAFILAGALFMRD